MLTAHLYQKLSELIPKNEFFAIAFSGGGDSTVLVHALRDHPQSKHVYIVDHNLRAGSFDEALSAKRFASTCGYESKLLKWKHNNPSSAIQEKARKARYGLMGGQCRLDGIKYLLTAHSLDDQAETLLMRYDRKTDWRGAAGMAQCVYGPVWPELAMVNVVRPLLDMTRKTLRDYTRMHDLKWAEDPSNENRDYARIRARDTLKKHPNLREELLGTAKDMQAGLDAEKRYLRAQFARIGKLSPHGFITLKELPATELLLHCLRAVSGQGIAIDRAKLKSFREQMRNKGFKSATLGGAMAAKTNQGYIVCRDPVAVKGRKDSHHARLDVRRRIKFRLSDKPQIWDGRFLVTGPRHRSYMGSVFHDGALLTPEQKDSLKAIPATARFTLPVSKNENAIRILGQGGGGIRVSQSLVRLRLEAALGGKLT